MSASSRVRRGSVRIAMIGQKGVPASFGGVERHVEEIGSRLVERGHSVTVYCRDRYCGHKLASHRGMALEFLPTVGTKHLDAIVHSALATVHAMHEGHDIIHFHALGPGLLAPLPKVSGHAKVVLTVHGRDDRRAKWGWGARTMLGVAGWMSERVPDATIVVSRALETACRGRDGHRVVYIPNGAPTGAVPWDGAVDAPAPRGGVLDRLGVVPGRYLLWVGRVVPEKAPDLLLRAFRRIDAPDARLVVVGDSSFTDGYTAEVRELARADSRVRMAGYQYGADLDELYRYAAAFVLPSALEGMPLTLLEAVAFGLPVVASDIAPHVEVLGRDSTPGRRLFPAGDEAGLAGALAAALREARWVRRAAAQLRLDVVRRYSWDAATDATARLYAELGGTADVLAGPRRAA
jgi:glycosyltransferase involved in cell wall biosynthesis